METLFDEEEIKPTRESLTPSIDMKSYKVKTLEEVKDYLEEIGAYNKIDEPLIKVYVNSLADYIRFSLILEKEGEVVAGVKGRPELHPMVTLKQKAFDNASRLADKLGILSLNRKKLSAETGAADDADPFNEFQR